MVGIPILCMIHHWVAWTLFVYLIPRFNSDPKYHWRIAGLKLNSSNPCVQTHNSRAWIVLENWNHFTATNLNSTQPNFCPPILPTWKCTSWGLTISIWNLWSKFREHWVPCNSCIKFIVSGFSQFYGNIVFSVSLQGL